jgi:uncharacterized protein
VTELHAIDYTMEFPYTRTVGPVFGPFLTGLRDGQIVGNRVGGRVLCPPMEFEPDTGKPVELDFVEVGPGGTVVGWTWVSDPSPKHPFQHPFAFALIKLDGADTAMVHAVDAGSIEAMSTGMRVEPQFAEERHGAIGDLHFVPEGTATPVAVVPGEEAVTITEHLIAMRIQEQLFAHRQRYVNGLLAGRIIGQKSPVDGKVYVPGRGYDNLNRTLMTEADEVEVADRGTVVAFTQITPVQYYGQKETEPYLRCSILLDGSDQPVQGIDIRDIPMDEFRIGMRLECVWKPEGERDASDVDNRYGSLPEGVYETWKPTGEPDVDPELVKEHSW